MTGYAIMRFIMSNRLLVEDGEGNFWWSASAADQLDAFLQTERAYMNVLFEANLKAIGLLAACLEDKPEIQAYVHEHFGQIKKHKDSHDALVAKLLHLSPEEICDWLKNKEKYQREEQESDGEWE